LALMEEQFLSDSEDDFAQNKEKDDDELSVDENDVTYGVTDDESSEEYQNEDDFNKDAIFEDQEEDSASTDIEAWGQNVNEYYGGVEDGEDLEALQEEADEAQKLQKARLKHQDFDDDEMAEFLDEEAEDAQKDATSSKSDLKVSTITKDISSYTAEEKLAMLEKDSPELFGLMEEMQIERKEITKLKTLLDSKPDASPRSVKRIRFFAQILVHYVSTIGFYLLLKSKGELHKDHPVFSRLLELRQKRDELRDEVSEEIKVLSGEKQPVRKKRKKAAVFGPQRKPANFSVNVADIQVEEPKKRLNIYLRDKRKDEHRRISRQIQKNVGLRRYRGKKNAKNPRVNMRRKFEKKQQIRKKQVRQYKGQPTIYRGERNINQNLVRARSFTKRNKTM